jgi:hypothetical protein
MVKKSSGKSMGGAEHPSPKSLKVASKVLRDPNATKEEKSLAAVVLGEGKKK